MAETSSSPSTFISGPRLIDGDALNGAFAAPQVSVAAGLTALGAALASALVLLSTVNQFSTVAANTGAALNPKLVPGQYQDIYNDGANPLTVYWASGTIDGGASVTLTNAKRCRYTCIAPGVVESAQWGVASA
jgi:hypothetical protein